SAASSSGRPTSRARTTGWTGCISSSTTPSARRSSARTRSSPTTNGSSASSAPSDRPGSLPGIPRRPPRPAAGTRRRLFLARGQPHAVASRLRGGGDPGRRGRARLPEPRLVPRARSQPDPLARELSLFHGAEVSARARLYAALRGDVGGGPRARRVRADPPGPRSRHVRTSRRRDARRGGGAGALRARALAGVQARPARVRPAHQSLGRPAGRPRLQRSAAARAGPARPRALGARLRGGARRADLARLRAHGDRLLGGAPRLRGSRGQPRLRVPRALLLRALRLHRRLAVAV